MSITGLSGLRGLSGMVGIRWIPPPPPPPTGTVYRIDSRTGDDAANGLTRPWKNITKIRQFQFKPGDVIELDENSVWREQTIFLPSSGTAEKPITIRSSGLGWPEVWGAAVLTGFTLSTGSIYKKTGITTPDSTGRQVIVTKTLTGWQRHSGSIYKKPNIGRPDIPYWQVHVEDAFFGDVTLRRVTTVGAMDAGTYCIEGGVLYVWLVDGFNPADRVVRGVERLRRATSIGNVSRASFWLDAANRSLYLWMGDDASPDTYDTVEWPTTGMIVNTNNQSYWRIEHIKVGKGGQSSFSARSNCSHITFSGCWSSWAGLRGFDFGGGGTVKHHIRAEYCLAENSINENYWNGRSADSGTQWCESHHGAVDQPNGYPTFFTAGHFMVGINSEDNYILDCYDHDSNTVNFRCCYIEMEAGAGNFRPQRTKVLRNWFFGVGMGSEELIRLEGEDTEFAYNVCQGNGGDMVRVLDGSKNEKIWYNTFINGQAGRWTMNVRHSSTVSAASPDSPNIQHNIFYQTGTARRINFQAVVGRPMVDNNCYYGGADSFSYEGQQTDFAGWRSRTPFDDNSITNNPLFVNLASGDYHLQSGSPAAQMGHWHGKPEGSDEVPQPEFPLMATFFARWK